MRGGGNRNFQNPFLFFFLKKFTNLKIEKLRPHFLILSLFHIIGIIKTINNNLHLNIVFLWS